MLTFDQWSADHRRLQGESDYSYAQRSFEAGMRGAHNAWAQTNKIIDDGECVGYVSPSIAVHSAGAQEPVAYTHPDRLALLASGKLQVETMWSKSLVDPGDVPLYTQPQPMTDAARDVLAERKRHMEVEGWTPEHDDAHDPGILAAAGCAYAGWAADMLHPYSLGDGDRDREGAPAAAWPFAREWWKPVTPRRALEKAAALILAEIERLDRAKEE